MQLLGLEAGLGHIPFNTAFGTYAIQQWKDFLAQHAEEIRQGKRFELSDPAVTPALVGRAGSWRLPDGTYWPVSRQEVVPD